MRSNKEKGGEFREVPGTPEVLVGAAAIGQIAFQDPLERVEYTTFRQAPAWGGSGGCYRRGGVGVHRSISATASDTL